MAYTSKKAMGRDSMAELTKPAADLNGDAKLSKMQSNQERGTGRGTRKVTASTASVTSNRYTGTNRVVGNLVKVAPNTKGTGTLKQPTAIAMASKDSTKPATANPDGGANRAATRKASGVRK